MDQERMPRSIVTAGQIDTLRAALPQSAVLPDEQLCRHTSFRIGGPADVLVLPGSVEDLATALRLARKWGLPGFVTGTGSNLLIRDGGLRGVVIKLADRLHRVEVE